MKEAKLIIDGKEYAVQMKDEDVRTVTRPKTGYEKLDGDIICYVINAANEVVKFDNDFGASIFLRKGYDTGNFYTDEQLAKDIARADELYRRLRQWQALNDKPFHWKGGYKYYIYYSYLDRELRCATDFVCKAFGTIYFSSEDAVRAAIEAFRDELTWYFTEFKQRLDERTIK